MKKTFLFITLTVLALFAFVSCGEGNTNVEKAKIEGVTFSDATYTYDGTEKSIAVSGNLPEGVLVSYSNEKATDAGTYNAVATLSGSGYETLVLEATLKINKADITGISAELQQSVTHDENIHKPTFIGNVPSGVNVRYIFDDTEYPNGVSAIGKYDAQIVFEGANYNTLTLSVEYSIKVNLAGLANSVIESFGSVPDAWAFLPDSFNPENRATEFKEAIDYSTFLNVSDIPLNGMGKQLNVVYGLFSKMQTAVGYLNIVYGSMNVVKNLYTAFLDNNPDNYESFTENAGPFTFTISIDGDSYRLAASISSVEIIIFSSLASESYGATIKLTENTVLKYTVAEEKLSIALNVLNANSTYMEFERNDAGEAVGVFYEYLTVSGVDIIATSAMIHVGSEYTTVIGTKGDFMPLSVSRNCEIYNNATGQYIGGEVREDIDGVIYNTYWFPLCDVVGINSIKKLDEMNFPNADTIYINGKESKIKTKLFGGNILTEEKFGSRRFDIEFKTFYFYNIDDEGEYKLVELEIPMIFIQEEKIETFEEDFSDANDTSVSLAVSSKKFDAISYAYTTLLPAYDALKDAVTREDIIEYCSK